MPSAQEPLSPASANTDALDPYPEAEQTLMAGTNSSGAPGRPLDAGSSEPLHLQLRAHLRAQILNHSLPPGTSLPSEAQLQVRYGVSRSVVRQALGALADEGLIERGRGRGITVAPRREHHRLVHRTSGLSAQLGSTGA
ncbi:GntR family transcriptional regulator, partial [Arthrobacter sp. Br18]|uniref:GntR family transcriptional regulator n=1 Tax=Arthrobacter sp. Br18 TaxID=1312954 RepID=UPI000479B998